MFFCYFKDRVGASAIFRLSRARDAIAAHAQQKQPADIQIVNIIKLSAAPLKLLLCFM